MQSPSNSDSRMQLDSTLAKAPFAVVAKHLSLQLQTNQLFQRQRYEGDDSPHATQRKLALVPLCFGPSLTRLTQTLLCPGVLDFAFISLYLTIVCLIDKDTFCILLLWTVTATELPPTCRARFRAKTTYIHFPFALVALSVCKCACIGILCTPQT